MVARFETSGGPDATATWTAYTGGDTTWTVEVTDDVVYTGGHMRWQNNPTAGDKPGQGAVVRTGVAALDPVNGMPYSWNPTRDRGVGIQDMMATSRGLYIGSDTTLIGQTVGNRYHAAHRADAAERWEAARAAHEPHLPAPLYTVSGGRRSWSAGTSTGSSVSAHRRRAERDRALGDDGGRVHGVRHPLHRDRRRRPPQAGVRRHQVPQRDSGVERRRAGHPDRLAQHRRPVADQPVLPQRPDLLHPLRTDHLVLAGLRDRGRRGGPAAVSGAAVSGIDYTAVRGAFVVDGKFYYATSTGQLFRADWSGSGPVGGTSVQVSGPGVDDQNWASRAMFVYDAGLKPLNDPPVAAASVSCAKLACHFDGSASTDSDGTVASYAWDFGDGTTGRGATVDHTYADEGGRTITLTVTDSGGETGTVTKTATPVAVADPVRYVTKAYSTGNRLSHTVTAPTTVQAGDTMLLFFAANVATTTYDPPAGWTQEQSQTGVDYVGQVYSKVATAADAGKVVTITSAVQAKDDMTLAVYRGADPTTPVTASASDIQDQLVTRHGRRPSRRPMAQLAGELLVGQVVGDHVLDRTRAADPPLDGRHDRQLRTHVLVARGLQRHRRRRRPRRAQRGCERHRPGLHRKHPAARCSGRSTSQPAAGRLRRTGRVARARSCSFKLGGIQRPGRHGGVVLVGLG